MPVKDYTQPLQINLWTRPKRSHQVNASQTVIFESMTRTGATRTGHNSRPRGAVWRKPYGVGRKKVVLVVQLVSLHSCVADRLPVVVRFPAGLREDSRP